MALLAEWACATAGVPPASPAAMGPAAASSPQQRPPTQGDTQHVTSPMGSSRGATTDAMILQRLADSVPQIPPGVSVPRIALADVAYPASQEELKALGGFALLQITVVCRDGAELPIDRVEARIGTAAAKLIPVVARPSELVSPRLAEAFGRWRYDAAYLIPVFATRKDATIIVYLGGGRFPLKVLEFPPPPGQDELPPDFNFDWDPYSPRLDALRAILDRELPVFRDIPIRKQ
jgi:hypothetical protein